MRKKIQGFFTSTLAGVLVSAWAAQPCFADEANAQSVSIKKPSADIIDYVYFAEPSDVSKREICADSPRVLRTWTVQEKRTVEQGFRSILREFPGLFLHLSSNGKYAICRCWVLHQTKKHPCGALAATGSGAIYIANGFFVGKRSAKLILLHELVHAADAGRQASTSKEWIDFAQPAISRMRSDDILGSHSAVPEDLKQFGHGFDNLQESLAEYFSLKLETHQSMDFDKPISSVAKRILFPDDADLRFSKHVKVGTIAVRTGDSDLALREFSEARKIKPDLPLVTYYISRCLIYLGKLKDAQTEMTAGIKLLDALGMSADEANRKELLAQQVWLKSVIDNSTTIGIPPEQYIQGRPMDGYRLRARAASHEMRNELGAAALDFYNAHKSDGILKFELFFGLDQPENSIEGYNRAVASKIRLGKCLQERGLFVESLADRELENQRRTWLYEKALHDYRASAKYEGGQNRDSLFGCARVSLKLNRLTDAVGIRDVLWAADEGSIPARIIDLEILQSKNRIRAAKREYENLKRDIADDADP